MPWVRLLHLPGYVSSRLIDLMANLPALAVSDIPLQHADLMCCGRCAGRRMWIGCARLSRKCARKFQAWLSAPPSSGLSNETEERFQRLLDFLQEMQFDHVGVFTYSPEEGTPAEALGDPIAESVKARREDLMNPGWNNAKEPAFN